MAVQASITVKKYDGVTDIVYAGLTGSGADGSPAIWRQNAGQPAGAPLGVYPIFRVWSQWNASKTARVLKWEYLYPDQITDTTTSVISAKDRCFASGQFVVPQAVKPAAALEASYQFGNLMGSTIMKNQMLNGWADT